MDSFVACVQRVTSYWGQQASYDCIAALAGVAFAPALGKGKVCSGCWMEFNSDLRTRFLGHALGFTTVSTGRPYTTGDVSFEQFSERARAAISRSGVLLVGPTPRWDIYTTWPPDLDTLLELQPCTKMHCSSGEDSGVRLYLLCPHEPALTRREATREALKFAAAATLGQVESDLASFGTALYDGLLRQMQYGPEQFCRAGGSEGHSCFQRKVCRTRLACRNASSFLWRAATFVPDLQDNRHLLMAAGAFETMALEFSRIAGLPAESADYRNLAIEKLRHVRALHEIAATQLDGLCEVL